MHKPPANATKHIEKGKAQMPKGIFDIIGKDQEKCQIADEMQPTCMKEEGTD